MQGPLVERLRFAILALFSVEIREAAQQTGELAVLWPQYLLPDMKRLLVRGYKAKQRPSGHNITDKFRDNGGAIPPNLLTFGNNDSNGYYMEACKKAGIKPHPARFPIQVPSFFIRFLTDPSDLVLDPFAGSNTTGEACEREHRKWIAMELNEGYLEGSRFRFDKRSLQDLLPFEEDIQEKTEEASLVSLFD